MKLYHKINQYMLERYPILWNTHFVWLFVIAILLHVLYFSIGNGLLTIETLKTKYVSNLFFNQAAFSIYVIICLIAFIYFAFRYFTHNPFRNFYPISKGYFWKVFASLFFLVFIYITVIISFENGMQWKSKKLVSKVTLANEIDQVNLAYPFLFNDINKYHILEKTYPKPFPLKELSEFEIGYNKENGEAILHGIDKNKPYFEFNNHTYQFGHIEMDRSDSCNPKEYIADIIDISKTPGLQAYSLLNFSQLCITEELGKYQSYADIAPIVHEWFLQKDQKAIRKCLQDLISICKKYDIAFQLNPEEMTAMILAQNLDTQPLLRVGIYNYKSGITPAESNTVYNQNYDDQDRRGNINNNYSIDLESMIRLSSNKENLRLRLGTAGFVKNGAWWNFLFISLYVSLLLLLAKYLKPKEILIGLIISGILGALSVLLFFILDQIRITHEDFENPESLYLNLSVAINFLIFGIGMWGIFNKRLHSSIVYHWFLSCCLAIMLLLPSLLAWVRSASKYGVMDACKKTMDYVVRFELSPMLIFGTQLMAIGIIFVLLKRLHAKSV